MKKIIAHDDPDLRDLIPGFLQSCHKDIKSLDAVLKNADLVKTRTPGPQ